MQEHQTPTQSPEQDQKADKMVQAERAATTLNTLSTLTGFSGVHYYFHEGEDYLTDCEGGVGLPQSALADTTEEIDVVDGIGHELCAHVYDRIFLPDFDADLKRWERGGKDDVELGARHNFNNTLTDIVGNNYKARVFPKLGEDQVEVYSHILYKNHDMRGAPRVKQVLSKLLRDAMVPGEQAVIDTELEQVYTDLVTALRGTFDRQNSTPEQKFLIWTELGWPVVAKLLDQDRQDKPDLADQLKNMLAQHGAMCGEGHGEHSHAQPQESSNGQTASSNLSDAVSQAVKQAAQKAQAAGAGAEAARDEYFGHTAEARVQYNQALQKYAGALDSLREAYREFLSSESVEVKKRKLSREGDEINPDELVLGYVASKAGVSDPAIFDETVTHEKIRTRPGPFDLYIVADATGSMISNGVAEPAAIATALLSNAFESYNHLTEELLEDPTPADLSRLAIISFTGSATIEQPISQYGTPRQHLDAFHHVKEAKGSNTLIHSGLDAIVASHEDIRPPRRKVVIVLTDGDDQGKPTTDISAATLENLGYHVEFWNFSQQPKGFRGEKLIGSPNELPGLMLAMAKSLVPDIVSEKAA